jgi:hypothetical protein
MLSAVLPMTLHIKQLEQLLTLVTLIHFKINIKMYFVNAGKAAQKTFSQNAQTKNKVSNRAYIR